MKKKNQQGFMLVELIITSTIVVASMVALYASFNKIYSVYKTKNTYYSIDGVYAIKEMTKHLIDKNFNEFIIDAASTTNTNPEEENTTPAVHYKYIVQNGDCKIKQEDENGTDVCVAIQGLYKVKNMIFTEYDKNVIEELKSKDLGLNETFLEYLDYVVNYYDILDEETAYNYIIFAETEEGKTNYYSNLRIR